MSIQITEHNLQIQVARWSLQNFGPQTSKVTKQPLYSLAPLLGLMEECLDELVDASTPEEARDALGDICIYMCDFASRDIPYVDINEILLNIEYGSWSPDETEALSNLCKGLGQLCHCILKRHQGIRGYDDTQKYVSERNYAITMILVSAPLVVGIKQPIMNFGIDTFTKIVSKRDWVANPQGE